MADYVINEWIWADSLGDNGLERQAETARCLFALERGPDRIVVVKGSGFYGKAWALCKCTDRLRRQIARVWKDGFFYAAHKCLLLEPSGLPELSAELQGSVEASDQYLVRAQAAVPDSIIVTSDNPLAEVLEKAVLPCLRREQFIAKFKM